MADGRTLINLDETRGVSNTDECSPEGSPQKMISDCSDLYDLINFHSSATTQICEEKNNRRSSSSSSPSPEIRKRNRSSSSSSGHSDGPDSDSGSFARTNGHAEPNDRSPFRDREVVPPASPESAVESCPEERATVTSSTELLSPADSPEMMNPEGPPLLVFDVDKPDSAVVHELDDLYRVDTKPQVADASVLVAVESIPSLHEPNNLLDLREVDAVNDEGKPDVVREVREIVTVTAVHQDDDEEPKIVHVEEKTTVVHTTEIRRHASGGGSDLDVQGTAADSVTDGIPGEVTVEEEVSRSVVSHHTSLENGGAKEVHDSPEAPDSSDHFEENHVESRIVVESVQIMNVVECTVTTTSSTKTDGEDTDGDKLEIPQLTQSIVLADDNHELHGSASGSDSDSEHYTPGKKFKQLKTKLVSESTTSVSSSIGTSTTSSATSKKVSEMKVELTTSKTELENGDATKSVQISAVQDDVSSAEQPCSSETDSENNHIVEESRIKREEEHEVAAELVLEELENPPSVAALKTTFVAVEPPKETEKETILTGVSIKDLKASFNEQKTKTEEMKHKEVIDTGVDIKSLRASYCDLARLNNCNSYKYRQTVNTGVSIRSLKSSFSSTDSVQHHEISESDGVKIDRNKITRNFSQVDSPLYAFLDSNDITNVSDEAATVCRICGKQVFHMERIKAEKGVFHKTCFRCKECSKSLSVDTYCSHEGVLYCRPHFRQLFQPKAKFDEEPIVIPHRRKHEMIIKENIPAELPPDVVRSADKPDYGLDEIPSLKNIKSRFESSETENGHDAALSAIHVKRSESIASKMAKFQGLESSENGHTAEDSSSSSDEDDDRDPQVVRSSKHKREKGKGSLKAKYESACEESIKSPSWHEAADLNGEVREIRTSSIKEKFEKGDVSNDNEIEKVEKILKEKEEDLSVFKEQGTASNARSMFKQIDASASKTTTYTSSTSPTGNVKRSPSMRSREVLCAQSSTVTDGEIVRASDRLEDDLLVPVDLSSKFKFFENYQDIQGTPERKRFTMTPPREPAKEESPDVEIARDPNIVRACDKEEEIMVTDTARKMLNKFREMEIKAEKEEIPAGPKPLKRITPPREYTKESEGSPEPEIARDPNIVRACDKIEDDFLIEAHKAKSLKEKFEHWDDVDNDIERENRKNIEDEIQQPSPETAKNLKAKFEALQEESGRQLEKPKSKINRFIDFGGGANGELCDICGKRVYTMEKLEVNGHKVHKTCFRCSHCGTILRMDNYTTSEGVLYCTPHFKQLFIARGNYDEGFGREQHKDRWNKNSRSSTPNMGLNELQYVNGDSSD